MTTEAPGWLDQARRLLKRADLWPGFHPLDTPFALYDGARTWLVSGPEIVATAGLHPDLRASTAAEVDGVLRAAVWGDPAWTPTDWAAVMAHEAFHVFQHRQHSHWPANEAAALTDPPDDAAELACRHAETRALAGGDAPAALACRAARAERLPPDLLAYERDLERFEGLAYRIEWQVRGAPSPVANHPPERIRLRAYQTGAAWARLLDNHKPGWEAEVNHQRMDRLLGEVVAAGFRSGPAAHDLERAERDIQQAQIEHAGLRAAVLNAPFTLTFEAATPLWPRSFDPMNLRPLGGGEVWHGRHLRLVNDSADIELFQVPGLSWSGGPTPLLSGVQGLTVALSGPPLLERSGPQLYMKSAGLSARLHAPVSITDLRPAESAWRVMLG